MEAIRQGDIPGVQLRKRLVVPARSLADVWPFLVEGPLLERWLADRVEAEEGPPRLLHLETREVGGRSKREYAEVVEGEEPRRLVLGFRELDAGWPAATRLTLELTGRPEGCEVMVLQEGFQQLPLSDCMTVWERSRVRWTRALERLAEAAGA